MRRYDTRRTDRGKRGVAFNAFSCRTKRQGPLPHGYTRANGPGFWLRAKRAGAVWRPSPGFRDTHKLEFPTQTDTSTTATLPGCRCNRGGVGPADGRPPQAQGRHSTAKELKPKLLSSQISNEGTEHCNKNKELPHCCVQTMRQGF